MLRSSKAMLEESSGLTNSSANRKSSFIPRWSSSGERRIACPYVYKARTLSSSLPYDAVHPDGSTMGSSLVQTLTIAGRVSEKTGSTATGKLIPIAEIELPTGACVINNGHANNRSNKPNASRFIHQFIAGRINPSHSFIAAIIRSSDVGPPTQGERNIDKLSEKYSSWSRQEL